MGHADKTCNIKDGSCAFRSNVIFLHPNGYPFLGHNKGAFQKITTSLERDYTCSERSKLFLGHKFSSQKNTNIFEDGICISVIKDRDFFRQTFLSNKKNLSQKVQSFRWIYFSSPLKFLGTFLSKVLFLRPIFYLKFVAVNAASPSCSILALKQKGRAGPDPYFQITLCLSGGVYAGPQDQERFISYFIATCFQIRIEVIAKRRQLQVLRCL